MQVTFTFYREYIHPIDGSKYHIVDHFIEGDSKEEKKQITVQIREAMADLKVFNLTDTRTGVTHIYRTETIHTVEIK